MFNMFLGKIDIERYGLNFKEKRGSTELYTYDINGQSVELWVVVQFEKYI